MTKRKVNRILEKENKLMAKFEEYTRSQNLHTSHRDFPHQQRPFPIPLLVPPFVDRPPGSPWANNEHAAS